MATLLRDVIEIPERVGTGDFVFKLSESVGDPQATVDSYVVTDQLVEAFGLALDVVHAALSSGSSKAAYLDSSFGGGKSHFMAMVRLLLEGNPAARAVPELAPVVAKNAPWLEGKRFLTPTFHLIGSSSLEEAILGGYVRYVRSVEPDAPVPDVFVDGPIVSNAETLRANMGDDAFFASLNSNADPDDPWGAVEAAWDRARYDEALAAPSGDRRRDDLVADLVRTHFTGYADLVQRSGSGFVNIDDGLGVISRHAHALGYDAVVLFLDELILWLISNIADIALVTREAQKIAKLVEGADARRPAPIVSFVARQRDLRELVGEETLGRERLGFLDTLKYWDGRFDKVSLDDRNLPVIANRRLLQPKPGATGNELREAFEQLRLRPDVRDVLLTNDADEALFQLVYPFSPAFISALVDVSAALQRERTALRVLLTLLVNRREELTVGDLVPVGDLYDALDSADTPFTDELKVTFAQARRLYASKLRPMLLAKNNLTDAQAQGSAAFRGDDRIIKTLLLAALVQNSAAFKDLTLSRLVALNHGSIRVPIAGTEQRTLLGKLKDWMTVAGEIRLGGDDQNPLVSVQLSTVDVSTILAKVQGNDSNSARRIKVRDAILAKFGLPVGASQHEYTTTWRGVPRKVDVLFGNLRDPEDLTDDNLLAQHDRWKVLIDFPFDAAGFGPTNDLRRIQRMRDAGAISQSVAWLPSFVNASMAGDLGKLVLIDYLLTGDNFDRNASHLSVNDRDTARILLDNQRNSLQSSLERCLLAAYQLEGGAADSLDPDRTVDEHFPTLMPDVRVRPPVAGDLRAGLDHILHQVLATSYPAAPKLGRLVPGRADLTRIFDVCKRAAADPQKRVADLDAAMRKLMKDVAEPLRLGTQHDQPFVLDDHWDRHMARKEGAWREAAGPTAPLTVRVVRSWLDDPEPMGLPVELSNLVILAWAGKTNRRILRHGGAIEEKVESLPDDAELRAQAMPSDAEWEQMVDRAGRLFGVVPSTRVATAGAVAKLAADVRRKAEDVRNPAIELIGELAKRNHDWEVVDSARLDCAEECRNLASAIIAAGTDDLGQLRAMVDTALVRPTEAVARTWSEAGPVLRALKDAHWAILESAARLGTPDGAALRAQVRSVLAADQLARPIGPALIDLVNTASGLLARQVAPTPSIAPRPVVEPRPDTPLPLGGLGDVSVSASSMPTVHAHLTVDEAQRVLAAIPRPSSVRVTLHIEAEPGESAP